LTPREESLQQALVGELGELSFSARRHVKVQPDPIFVEQKTARLKKERLAILYFFIGALVLFLYPLYHIFHYVPLDKLILLPMSFGLGGQGLMVFMATRKKATALKLLTILNEGEQSE